MAQLGFNKRWMNYVGRAENRARSFCALTRTSPRHAVHRRTAYLNVAKKEKEGEKNSAAKFNAEVMDRFSSTFKVRPCCSHQHRYI